MIARRTLLKAAGAALISAPAMAQAKLLRLIVGFPAGGVVDIVARELAEQLRDTLGGSVIVENRVGAGGRIAVTAVKTAEADGYTLLLTPSSMMTLYPSVFTTLPYDPLTDFAPISSVCMSTNALAIGAHIPARTMAEFIAWCKANPKEANYASPGAGSAPHLLGAQIAKAAGIDLLHVPYRGAPDILRDLYGGRLASFVTALANAVEPHRDGKLRLLLTTAESRSALLPDVPTAKEAGYPELTTEEWFGLFAPAQTPGDRVAALHAAVGKAVVSDAYKRAFGRVVLEPNVMTPSDFARRIRADIDHWKAATKALNYQPVSAQ
jgi:tripartite-type tricarboxylate transporter receptor subunit TctC